MPGTLVDYTCTWPQVTGAIVARVSVTGGFSGNQRVEIEGGGNSHNFQFYAGEAVHQEVFTDIGQIQAVKNVKDFVVGQVYGPCRNLKVTRTDKVCLTGGYALAAVVGQAEGVITNIDQPSPYPSPAGIYTLEWQEGSNTWEGSATKSNGGDPAVTELFTVIASCNDGVYEGTVVSDTWGPVGGGSENLGYIIPLTAQPARWEYGSLVLHVIGTDFPETNV